MPCSSKVRAVARARRADLTANGLAQFSPDTSATGWLTVHIRKLLKTRCANPAKMAGFRNRGHGCLSRTLFKHPFSQVGTAADERHRVRRAYDRLKVGWP